MKILILIDWFAPAFKGGGPIQSIMNMVEDAGKGLYEYRIICSNKDMDGSTIEVVTNKWVDYNRQTKVWYNSSKNVLRIVNRESVSWGADLLFINGIYSLHYNFFPIVFGKAPRKILSVRGMLHDGALSQKAVKKKLYLKVWRLLNLHNKCEFHASTGQEKEFVQKVFGKEVKVSIAANFPRIFRSSVYPLKQKNSLNLISIALISPMKNH